MVIVCRKHNVQISVVLVHIKLKKSKEMNVLVTMTGNNQQIRSHAKTTPARRLRGLGGRERKA